MFIRKYQCLQWKPNVKHVVPVCICQFIYNSWCHLALCTFSLDSFLFLLLKLKKKIRKWTLFCTILHSSRALILNGHTFRFCLQENIFIAKWKYFCVLFGGGTYHWTQEIIDFFNSFCQLDFGSLFCVFHSDKNMKSLFQVFIVWLASFFFFLNIEKQIF